jgi:hypothetical protein
MTVPETQIPLTSNGLGYASASAPPAAAQAPVARAKGADELEIRLEFG